MGIQRCGKSTKLQAKPNTSDGRASTNGQKLKMTTRCAYWKSKKEQRSDRSYWPLDVIHLGCDSKFPAHFPSDVWRPCAGGMGWNTISNATYRQIASETSKIEGTRDWVPPRIWVLMFQREIGKTWIEISTATATMGWSRWLLQLLLLLLIQWSKPGNFSLQHLLLDCTSQTETSSHSKVNDIIQDRQITYVQKPIFIWWSKTWKSVYFQSMQLLSMPK